MIELPPLILYPNVVNPKTCLDVKTLYQIVEQFSTLRERCFREIRKVEAEDASKRKAEVVPTLPIHLVPLVVVRPPIVELSNSMYESSTFADNNPSVSHTTESVNSYEEAMSLSATSSVVSEET